MASIVYNEDCMEGMARYPDKYFELAIVDPPYGIGESYKDRSGIFKNIDKRNGRVSYIKINNEIKYWDSEPPNSIYFTELFRVSQNQIISGANHYISKMPYDSSCWIVWDKCNGSSDFADCELFWTSFKSAVRLYRFMWSGMFQGKHSLTKGHIFEGNLQLHEKRIHKTQKPVALYDWLLKNYAKPGDKILDTHLGSGSSRIAAYKAGYDFTGFEIDKEYFDAAEKRFQNFISQPTIFEPVKNDIEPDLSIQWGE